MLRLLAEGRPIALLFDDMHEANDVAVELAVQLVWSIVGRPLHQRMRVLPVMAYRPEQLHRDHPLTQALEGLESEQRTWLVPLRRLTPPELGSLMAEHLGTGNLPAALSDFVVARSGGLPGFAMETLRWLEAENYVTRRGTGVETDPAALHELELASERGELPVPAAITESVKRRLLGLSTAALGALQIGALLGHGFPRPVIAEVLSLIHI